MNALIRLHSTALLSSCVTAAAVQRGADGKLTAVRVQASTNSVKPAQ